MLRTPREAALEARVAELERELMILNWEQPEPPSYEKPPHDDEISLSIPHPVDLRMMATWVHTNELEQLGDSMYVLGYTYPKYLGDSFQVSYYTTARELEADSSLNLLGCLHDQVVRMLADEIRKGFKK